MKRFIFHDENTKKDWIFYVVIGELDEIELDTLIDDLLDDSHDFKGEDLESTYGVHDIAFDHETDVLGFTSYEIDEEKFPELMEKWKEIFKNRGFLISESL